MKVVFRCDASMRLGMGHLMRCLTLATVLFRAGATISFVCRKSAVDLTARLRSRGFEVALIGNEDTDEIVPVSEDARETAAILADFQQVDWLVVDHYALGADWELVQRKYARNIMVIDDLANRRHDCDILLDQNLFADANMRYQGLLPDGCRPLLGPHYALLRQEFMEYRNNSRINTSKKRLFVSFGGGDFTNETAKVLNAIRDADFTELVVDVVIGAANLNYDKIAELCASISNVKLYREVDNMAELMAAADFCIGGGGSTTWERCCIGLPSIVITVALNQIEPMQQLAEAGAIILYTGSRTASGYREALEALLTGRYDLHSISKTGQMLYDGEGALRVYRSMTEVS
ncbi:MAG: pseudaminic acid biosynthesis-associated protein PseG [Firmicutes bacterium]|nr:pseudaminic acid biosynthesis-associated protein PseG [Bacillota bacterium]